MTFINKLAKSFIEAGKGGIEKSVQRKNVQNGVTDYNSDGKTSIFEHAKSKIADTAYPAEAKYHKEMEKFKTNQQTKQTEDEYEKVKKAEDAPIQSSFSYEG